MHCRKIRTQLTAYIDGAVSREAQQAIKSHVQDCPNCQRELSDIYHLVERIKKAQAQKALPENFTQSVLARLDDKAREAILPNLPVPNPLNRWSWVGVSVAAAAALVVIVKLSLNENPTAPDKESTPYIAEKKPIIPTHKEEVTPVVVIAGTDPEEETAALKEITAEEPQEGVILEDTSDEVVVENTPTTIETETKIAEQPEEEASTEPDENANSAATEITDSTPEEKIASEAVATESGEETISEVSPGENETGIYGLPDFENPQAAIRDGSFEVATASMDLYFVKLGLTGELQMLQAAFQNPNEAVALAALERNKHHTPTIQIFLLGELKKQNSDTDEKRLKKLLSELKKLKSGSDEKRLKKLLSELEKLMSDSDAIYLKGFRSPLKGEALKLSNSYQNLIISLPSVKSTGGRRSFRKTGHFYPIPA